MCFGNHFGSDRVLKVVPEVVPKIGSGTTLVGALDSKGLTAFSRWFPRWFPKSVGNHFVNFDVFKVVPEVVPVFKREPCQI
jgi:hypothetical protein